MSNVKRFVAAAVVVWTAIGLQAETGATKDPVRHLEPKTEFIAPKVAGHVHASTLLPVKDGLLVAWFEGAKEGAPDVAIKVSRRTAPGVWEPVRVAAKVDPNLAHWNPVLRRRQDGKVELYFKVSARPGSGVKSWRTFSCISDDEGVSWSAAKELVPGDDTGGRGPVKNKCLRLKDGRLLAPASTEIGPWRSFVDISDDDGRTWRKSAVMPVPEGIKVAAKGKAFGMIQPTLFVAADGSVVALMRTNGGKVWQSRSRDCGETWEMTTSTALDNINSGLDAVKASDGKVYLVLNGGSEGWGPRYKLDLFVSADDGATWRFVKNLICDERRDEKGRYRQEDRRGTEFSYPAILEVRPGVLGVTYTWNRQRIAYLELPLSSVFAIVPTLHMTDLFRPYADPDDHWDLATQYALARRGDIDLLGVVIDDPVRTADLREARKKVKVPVKNPDIAAVAQLNWLTGLSVPVGVGQPKDEDGKVRSGLALVRRTLEASSSPVVLHVVGACTDVVEAADRWPELFRAKVKAIYVNAGTADDSDGQEYNVLLDPKTYGRVFALPCPIYWLPCFQRLKAKKGVHASYWTFAQHRAFSEMRPGVLNFFTGVFGKRNGTDWLSIIQAPVNEEAVKKYGEARRNMWCTAGFLHAAGLVVLRDGTIARIGEKPSEELFSFDPVLTDCHAQTGVMSWRAVEKPGNRFLLHVKDATAYEEAMTRALVHLMKNL